MKRVGVVLFLLACFGAGFYGTVRVYPIRGVRVENSKPNPIVALTPYVEKIGVGFEHQHAATHKIVLYDIHNPGEEVGHCSGTAVGPHSLLTAGHCNMDSNQISLDASPNILHIRCEFPDGNDHILYLVDTTFVNYVEIEQRSLTVKEKIHLWGAPGLSSDVFRIGYFSGINTEKQQAFVLPIFRGDSGSAIFDEDGHVVAIVSQGNDSAGGFAFPLKFSAEQLRAIL